MKEKEPDDIIDADNAMRPRGSAVMYDSGAALHPNPSAVFGQKTIIFCSNLAFQ